MCQATLGVAADLDRRLQPGTSGHRRSGCGDVGAVFGPGPSAAVLVATAPAALEPHRVTGEPKAGRSARVTRSRSLAPRPGPQIVSLGTTLARWRSEILAHHDTGASNGPTAGLNLCVKKVKRCGHGFRRFEHYRLRVLLHAGGVT